tara:strand:- start:279 stop:473 length:195 start_codon:yes stop_codon:yes gene_type:complete
MPELLLGLTIAVLIAAILACVAVGFLITRLKNLIQVAVGREGEHKRLVRELRQLIREAKGNTNA